MTCNEVVCNAAGEERHNEAFRVRSMVALAVLAVVGVGCGDDDDEGSGERRPRQGRRHPAGTGSREDEAGRPASRRPRTPAATSTCPGRPPASSTSSMGSNRRSAATTPRRRPRRRLDDVRCDAKGTPEVFVSCGDTLLDRNVDAVRHRHRAVPHPGPLRRPSSRRPGRRDRRPARSDRRPPATTARRGAGRQGARDSLFKRLGVEGGDVTTSPPPGATRAPTNSAGRRGSGARSRSRPPRTDAANLVQFTRKTVTDQLTQNPDVKAFWFTFDTTGQVGGQASIRSTPARCSPTGRTSSRSTPTSARWT